MKRLLATAAALAILAGPAFAHERHHGHSAPAFFPHRNVSITIGAAPIMVFFPHTQHAAAAPTYSGPSTETVYYDGPTEAAKAAARVEFCKQRVCAKEIPIDDRAAYDGER